MSERISPNTKLSHYLILSKLGAGGMGEVYLAQDTKLDRQVALKLLPVDVASNSDRMDRFIREAKSAAALSHPNIAQIHEIGEHDGTHFIVMEFIDGVTLRDAIHRDHVGLATLLRHLQHTAEGLGKAHAVGIVHRDLKPDNIMITRDGHAKILDFGLAKLVETEVNSNGESNFSGEEATVILQQRSTPGMILGTVGYMSPEQAQGRVKEIDQRSDIFSFGCILYESATGRKAFAGKDVLDSLHLIVHGPTPQVKDVRADLPDELQRIVRRCLAKDPNERFQSIKEVAIELKEVRRELEQMSVDITAAPALQNQTTSPLTVANSTRSPIDSSLSTRASSAEYVVTGIKHHKLAVGLVALIVIAGIAALGFYLRGLNAESTVSSLAVMPFVNESKDQEIEYLTDGMTETLIKSLSQLPNLAVKSRSTVFYYKGKETSPKKIGEELNVQAVLLGRVVQRGDDLKLNLELVNTSTQDVIWSEQYSRKTSDLVSLQSEIARDVSSKLKSKLSGVDEAKVTKPSTENTEAYQSYLKGRYYWNRRTTENIKKAIEQFKAATDRDPNYALAYAGLADCYVVLNYYAGTPSSETLPQAKAYAERAIAIDNQLAEPHASLGQVGRQSWQWAEAEREYKRAIELNPNYATAYHWYSIFLKGVGRFDESAAMIKRAREIDPLSSVIAMNISEMYQWQNDHQASIENSLKVIELDPNYSDAYTGLGRSYLKVGRSAEALANFEKGIEMSKRASVALAELGYGYGVTGKRSEAIAIAKELEGKYARKESNGRYVAAVYAGLGDKDKAFEWLEKDFQQKEDLTWTRWEIPYESLRNDPRYKDLLRRMNLPE